MRIEDGDMVTVVSGEMAEKMKGIVGLVIEVMRPDEKKPEDGDEMQGDVPLYRIEFLSNRLRMPTNCPIWWPESELEKAE